MLKRSLLCLALVTAALAQTHRPQYFGRGIWRGQEVDFRVVNGLAIYQGDIVIGDAAELEARYRAVQAAGAGDPAFKLRESLSTSDQRRLWPGGVIPYEIDPVFADTSNIQTAVDHWNTRTAIHLQPRNGEANYVRFTPYEDPSACASTSIGMKGGVQYVYGTETCPAVILIHEIGHAVGLDHEQARSDRAKYVRILWENLTKPGRTQFNTATADNDVGPYDYNSIMHYGVGDFGKNRQPGMETLPPGIPLRQNTVLSDGDLDGVARLYGFTPQSFTVSSTPSGLQILVDGATVTTPQAFSWSAGSVHTLDVSPVQSDANGRYEFARWSDNGERAHSITADFSATIYTANFVRYNKFNLGVTPDGAGSVSISPPSTDGYYRDGTLITIIASANDGYTFAHWTGPFIDQNNLTNYGPNPVGFFAHAQLQGFTALFTPKQATVADPIPRPVTRFVSVLPSGASAGAEIRIDGKLYNLPASFLWDPGSVHAVDIADSFPNGSDQSLRVFQSWNDGADRVRQVTAGSDTTVYTATYGIKYFLGYAWNNGGSLSVAPVSSDQFYDAGSTVTVTAVPAPPLKFGGWAQDFWGQDNPFSIAMSETLIGFGFFIRPGTTSALGVADAARARANIVLSGNTFIGSVAPGEAVNIYSPDFGPDHRTDAAPDDSGNFPTMLAGVRALFNGVPAPLSSVGPGQVAAMVPYSLAPSDRLTVQLEHQGVRTTAAAINIVAVFPSVFTADGTGKGQAQLTNEDGSANSRDNPAAKGSVVALSATGLGAVNNGIPAGVVEVRMGGKVAELVSISRAANQPGVHILRARVPDAATSNNAATLMLTVDGVPSQFDLTIALQ